jgi:hypothetical protein
MSLSGKGRTGADRKPTALRKADLVQYLTALCEGGRMSRLCWCAVLTCKECHCPTKMTCASSR